MTLTMNIGVITPIKNEDENLPLLIESVKNQSLKPAIWVLVDDGSTDNSGQIIASAAESTEWIHTTSSNNNELDYKISDVYIPLGVGFEYLQDIVNDNHTTMDYYMVLDADMQLSRNYIERLVNYLEANNEVGIISGPIYIRERDKLKKENRHKNHPAGGATLYDGDFYRSINGPPQVPGRDSASEIKAKNRGFKCEYVDQLDIKAVQNRPTGGKGNTFSNSMMRGEIYYRVNMHPIVILLNFCKKVLQWPPYTGVGFFTGYLMAWIYQKEKIDDTEIKEYNWNVRPRKILEKLSARFSD